MPVLMEAREASGAAPGTLSPPRRSRRTHDSVGHQVMPVELPAAVVLLVEVLHLRDEVFQLRGKGDEDLLAAPRPRSSVQDLDVDGVGWRVTAQLAAHNSQTLTSTEPGAELSRSLRKTWGPGSGSPPAVA